MVGDVADAGKRFLTLTLYARWATLASESVSRTRRGNFMSSRCGGVAAAVREIDLLAGQVGTSRGAWCCERLAFLEAARSAPRRTSALRRPSPHSLRAAETFRDETAPVDKAQAGAWDNVPQLRSHHGDATPSSWCLPGSILDPLLPK
jgi:hypothetical protein